MENNIDEIKSDRVQNIDSLDIKYNTSHQSTPPHILNPYQQTATAGQQTKQ